jgi:histidinol phosphatase-like enzyme
MAAEKLILLDLDGTLAVKWEARLLPGRTRALAQLQVPVVIVTNQGGVHARYAMEQRGEDERASDYPTLASIWERLEAITQRVPQIVRAYVALYVGHDEYPLPADRSDRVRRLKSGVLVHAAWDPAWRKPAGGMLRQACCDLGIARAQTLMVGNQDGDREAARFANVRYRHVDGKPWPADFFVNPAAS